LSRCKGPSGRPKPLEIDPQLHRGRDLVDVLPARPAGGEESLGKRVLGDHHLISFHRATPRNDPAEGAVTSITSRRSRGTTSLDAWSKHRATGHAIDPVADDAAAERFARVHANLVRAAGQGPEFNQRSPIADGETAPVRDRLLAGSVADHPPSGFRARALRQRHVDCATLLLNVGRNHRKVVFLYLSRLERLLERSAGAGIARKQQTSGSVLVEPMHWRRIAAKSASKLRQPGRDRLPATPRLVDRQPGRLVNHHCLIVDE
jgi:hypothetical protein